MGYPSELLTELTALIEAATDLKRNQDAAREGEERANANQEHFTLWPARMSVRTDKQRAQDCMLVEEDWEIELVRQLKRNYYDALAVLLADEHAIVKEIQRYAALGRQGYELRVTSVSRRRPDRNRQAVTGLITVSVQYGYEVNITPP